MIFSVMYKIPNTEVHHFIDSYDITESDLYIPKFLLLKLANFSMMKFKGNLNFNDSTVLEYLIHGFTSIHFLNEKLDFLEIYERVNDYLLNTTKQELKNFYLDLINPNEDGYAPFEVLEEVD